ncbi:hypothetical protein E5676_scaffold2273G00110 [Cucumis melo var. makuwa]|uniref:Uncharacterized protein n=1 Tax=Cucumis melo var. makuwa TaxID=1194695 RepID=A0A5A7UDV1_CUCMM|nr:hypothetical protein E6C27_scaffold60G003310 [Cucumis melo var. makuwa]TYK17149.1 hypothetical protein E5676_scaffold2273G00110 [Cucumis melo var. makuwa]
MIGVSWFGPTRQSSISGCIVHRESSSPISRIMQWSCTYSSGLKVIESQVFRSEMAQIHEIEPTNDERTYLYWNLEILTMEGYEEGPHDPPPSPAQHPHSPLRDNGC